MDQLQHTSPGLESHVPRPIAGIKVKGRLLAVVVTCSGKLSNVVSRNSEERLRKVMTAIPLTSRKTKRRLIVDGCMFEVYRACSEVVDGSRKSVVKTALGVCLQKQNTERLLESRSSVKTEKYRCQINDHQYKSKLLLYPGP